MEVRWSQNEKYNIRITFRVFGVVEFISDISFAKIWKQLRQMCESFYAIRVLEIDSVLKVAEITIMHFGFILVIMILGRGSELNFKK